MKKYLIFVSLILLLMDAYSYPTGVALRTRKTTTLGCGNCHIFGTSLTGGFSGPDSVNTGQTVQFTIQYLGTNAGLYGVDIAAKFGALSPGSSSAYLKILSDELVQKSGLTVTALTFDYTAPLLPGTDTLFATIDKGEPGAWNWVPGKRIVVRLPAGIKNETGVALGYGLKQNYPNPFNPVTKIVFSVPHAEFVSIRVYDIQGREIEEIVSQFLQPGVYSCVWNASDFPSGIYYYRFGTQNFIETKSMILLR
jgi:hypothetical protein